MKKIIIAAALFITAFAQAQIEVWDGDVQLENNQTYTYNTWGDQAKMHFLVKNNTEETINVKLKMVDSPENPNGTGVQFCYGGYCFFTAPEGTTLAPPGPPNSETQVLPNGTSGSQNYFFNQFAIDGVPQPVSYVMAIVHVDAAGAQLGEPIITFTYKYAPTAGVTDFAALEQMGIAINNTVVKSTLSLTANQNAKLQIVNINGQTVKSVAIVNGAQSIDLSSVATGVYFARFTTEENKTAQIKIVKN